MPLNSLYYAIVSNLRLEDWFIPAENAKGTVLMFHGHGAAKDSLLPAAKEIHKLGWNCLLVDFHGGGNSEGHSTSIGWFEANDVTAARFHRGRADIHPPFVLYGVSMGSAAVLRSIHESGAPPDGVILELPFDTLPNAIRQRFKAMGLPSFPFAEVLALHGGWQAGFNAFEHEPARYARSVTCPALVLNTERDPRAPPKQAMAVFRNLAGPRQRRQFTGLGHVSIVENAPEDWSAAVKSLLQTVHDHR